MDSFCTYNSLKEGINNNEIKFARIRYSYKGLNERCYLLNDVFVLHWCVQSFHHKLLELKNRTRSTVYLFMNDSMGKNDYLFTAVDVCICPACDFKKHYREYFDGLVIPLFDADIGGLDDEEISDLDDALYSVLMNRPHLWDQWFTWFVDNTVNKLMPDGLVVDWDSYKQIINYQCPTEFPTALAENGIAFYNDDWGVTKKSYVTDYGLTKSMQKKQIMPKKENKNI